MHAPADSAAIPADRTQATSTLKAIFGVDFHVAGEAPSATQSVALTLSVDGTVSRALAMHALKAALTRMRMNNSQSGQGPLESLAASFVRAQAAQKASDDNSAFVEFWMDMCGPEFPIDYFLVCSTVNCGVCTAAGSGKPFAS